MRTGILIGAVAMLVACRPPDGGEGEGEGEGEQVPRPDFSALEDAIAADLELNLASGAQVAVWMNDTIFKVGSFGTRDPLTDEPVTDHTQFCIGSDTKKLTSLAALLRVADGSLSREDTLADALPDLSLPNATPFLGASLHALLSNTGGPNDWFDLDTETTDDALRSVTYGAFADAVYAMAPPGVFFNYANPNFSLPGLVIEDASGAPFADVLEDELFAPLGMSDTVARKASVGDEGAGGTGLTVDGTGPTELGFDAMWETAFVRPAGMVWSTAEDQMRLARFLVDGDDDVLDDALRALITTGHTPLYPDLASTYGYGMFIDEGFVLGDAYYEVPVWRHGGNTLAHTSTFLVLPEQRFAISILSNGRSDDFAGSVAVAVASLVDLPEPATPPVIPTPTEESLLALAGTYVDVHNVGELIVTSTGTTLSISMPAVDDAGIDYEPLLSPVTARVFRAQIQGVEMVVSFFDGPDGTLYFATRYFVAARPEGQARLHAPDASPERLRAALAHASPPSRWPALVGPSGLLGDL